MNKVREHTQFVGDSEWHRKPVERLERLERLERAGEPSSSCSFYGLSVSNAPMKTTRLHSDQYCTMMLKLCPSSRHHSLMSSIHSLLGLPLLFCPSAIPNPTFCTNRLSSILYRCTWIIFVSSPWSIAPHSFWCQDLSLKSIFYAASEGYVHDELFRIAFHLKCHRRVYVSLRPGSRSHVHIEARSFIAHVLLMLSFFRVPLRTRFHTFFNSTIASVARAILYMRYVLMAISDLLAWYRPNI